MEICRSIIDHPGAWTPASVGGKAGLTRALDPDHLRAIDELLARTRHLAPLEPVRQDWDHPVFNALLGELRDTIMNGRGAVVVSGLDRDRYSDEDFRRLYWGFGTHLGVAVEQSQWGDRIGQVRKENNDPIARGYRGDQELTLHTDSYELASLLCLHQAASGGMSGLASSLAIHNEILRTRPDLLPPLYEGYYYHIDELKFTERPFTDVKVPVFSCVDGKVSCNFGEKQLRNGALHRHEKLPPALDEAVAYFASTAARPDIRLSFMLEPGEMLLWHNFTNLHARTAFTNSPERERLLLRLWLDVPDGRPLLPAVLARANAFRWVYDEVKKKSKELA